MKAPFRLVIAMVIPLAGAVPAFGWDYEGHRMVNQIGLASLPEDFPAFVREKEAAERIAFLSGEADRWRNNRDLPLKHSSSPDHYFDYEQLAKAGLDPATVPEMRYLFATLFAAGRTKNAAAFPPINPAKNADHTDEWPGFLPWTISEYYGRLKSGFSYLKVYEELGTPDEIANARANVVYIMGVMGHFVGDGAQPLHMTIHHNGWVGDNPAGYTTSPGFHAWIDGGFVEAAGIKPEHLLPRVTPAAPLALAPVPGGRDPFFIAMMDYAAAQHAFVEPIYKLEKAGAFREENAATSTDGKTFIEARLLAGGQMLGSIWVTAWKQAGPDGYLHDRLVKRRAGANPPVPAVDPP